MKFQQRDWMFIAVVFAVLAFFIAISGKEKTKKLPHDVNHQQFHDMLDAGKKKNEVDPLCASCHDGQQVKFPANHPAKPGGGPMRCLFCHKSK